MFPFEILNYVPVLSIYNKAQDVCGNAFQIRFPFLETDTAVSTMAKLMPVVALI
jgi:hypothetical protein